MEHRNPDTWTPEFAREIERVREYVATLHAELPRWGLVVWTAGNVSQRVRASGGFRFFPSPLHPYAVSGRLIVR